MTSRIKLTNIKPCIEIENILFDCVKRDMKLREQQTKSLDLFNDLGIDKVM